MVKTTLLYLSIFLLLIFGIGCSPKITQLDNKSVTPIPQEESGVTMLPYKPNSLLNSDLISTSIGMDQGVNPTCYTFKQGQNRNQNQNNSTNPYHQIQVQMNGNTLGGVVWKSNRDLSKESQEDLLSASGNIGLRVVVKESSRTCPLINLPEGFKESDFSLDRYRPYTKLSLVVAVVNPAREKEASLNGDDSRYWQKVEIPVTAVNECSAVTTFLNVPQSSDPLILEILDVKSNYLCLHGQEKYCPLSFVQFEGCFDLELQLSTSDTVELGS